MLEKIINELGDNYNENDEIVLRNLIDEVTYSALSITNRTIDDIEDLNGNIERCVIIKYLQRGGEGTTSYSELGKSASFIDPIEKMKKELIIEGKRRVC